MRAEREALGISRRESGVPPAAPLHRSPDAVAIAEIDIVAHADLVAVIDDRATRQRHQQSVHQLHTAPVSLEQRREPPANAEVHPCDRITSVFVVHVVPFFLGHHLERELVVVSQKDSPLARVRNRRRPLDDLDDGLAVLQPERHEHPRHQWEVERHVELRRPPRNTDGRPPATDSLRQAALFP